MLRSYHFSDMCGSHFLFRLSVEVVLSGLLIQGLEASSSCSSGRDQDRGIKDTCQSFTSSFRSNSSTIKGDASSRFKIGLLSTLLLLKGLAYVVYAEPEKVFVFEG